MSFATLRILDANLNRAREGLRVWEDYVRFVLNHDKWSAELKQMRHALRQAVQRVMRDALHHRNTPGDVGTDNKTPAELSRAGLAEIVTAAGKRVQEALRAIEECLKTIDAVAAREVELIRYQSYDLELRLARTLRPGRFDSVRLYVLVTVSVCSLPWLETAELALQGGATCIQLREKELESGELLQRSRLLAALCARYDALCIVNDRPDIALLAGADGVHVGQGDLACAEVRKIVGDHLIVGLSTHSIEQARAAVLDGADYIGVGPVFPSQTKPRDILPGLLYARAAAATVNIPTVAIAGITLDNAAEVLATGVRSLAVSSAVISQPDPRATAAEFMTLISSRASHPPGQLAMANTSVAGAPQASRSDASAGSNRGEKSGLSSSP